MGLSRLEVFRVALMYYTYVKKVREPDKITKHMNEDGFSFEEQCEFGAKIMLEVLSVRKDNETDSRNDKIPDLVFKDLTSDIKKSDLS